MELDWFDKNLITDGKATKQKFPTSQENIPKSCGDNRNHPIKFDSSIPVAELIRVMRNKVRNNFV